MIINYQMKCAPSQITGVSHNYKKELRVGMSSLKKKVLSTDFKESEDAESFEGNCQLCLRGISWD